MATIIDGNGVITAQGTPTSAGKIVLSEVTGNGIHTVTLVASPSIASNVEFSLPATDGTAGQVLQTNGSGALTFITIPDSSISLINSGVI